MRAVRRIRRHQLEFPLKIMISGNRVDVAAQPNSFEDRMVLDERTGFGPQQFPPRTVSNE